LGGWPISDSFTEIQDANLVAKVHDEFDIVLNNDDGETFVTQRADDFLKGSPFGVI
jgi:hypothetical protein